MIPTTKPTTDKSEYWPFREDGPRFRRLEGINGSMFHAGIKHNLKEATRRGNKGILPVPSLWPCIRSLLIHQLLTIWFSQITRKMKLFQRWQASVRNSELGMRVGASQNWKTERVARRVQESTGKRMTLGKLTELTVSLPMPVMNSKGLSAVSRLSNRERFKRYVFTMSYVPCSPFFLSLLKYAKSIIRYKDDLLTSNRSSAASTNQSV